ncbi:hypothetical protein AB0D37_29610 [Streptomyces sp. NPDC048384]|uniref:hypothetical protein n=1 Tax=Streptomyces sp. NPDC048384 TaxID=3155487 RepID=UPI003445FC7A
MTRLRSLFATAAVVALLTGATAAGTAAAAEDADAREPGCAHVVAYGYGWADVWNECGYTIYATVEVDGFDPPCIQIGPGATARIGLEPGDTPYYAYEC